MLDTNVQHGAEWNDQMYRKHPTPYQAGVAGVIQRARVRAVLQYAGLQSTDRVIELGCERGELLASCAGAGELIGVDLSLAALYDARQLFGKRQLDGHFLQVNLDQPLPITPGAADVVICSEVLEHVPDPTRVTGRIAGICTPETRVVLTVPVEKPKVAIKRMLKRVGMLGLLFPGIEEGQSEWHLHAFNKRMLLDVTWPWFQALSVRNVWGSHVVGLFRLKAGPSDG